MNTFTFDTAAHFAARAYNAMNHATLAACFAHRNSSPDCVKAARRAREYAESCSAGGWAKPDVWATLARAAAKEALTLARELRRDPHQPAKWNRLEAMVEDAGRCCGFAQRDFQMVAAMQ